MKVYLVGLHHKPGLPALCSTTISGKRMDEFIEMIAPVQVIKTNLFTANFIPLEPDKAAKWWWDIHKPSADDLILLLGNDVEKYFHRRGVTAVKIYHPAKRMSFINKQRYLLNAAQIVSDYQKLITSPSDWAQTTTP